MLMNELIEYDKKKSNGPLHILFSIFFMANKKYMMTGCHYPSDFASSYDSFII